MTDAEKRFCDRWGIAARSIALNTREDGTLDLDGIIQSAAWRAGQWACSDMDRAARARRASMRRSATALGLSIQHFRGQIIGS